MVNYTALLIPVLLLLVALEWYLSKLKKKKYFNFNDSVNNFALGITEMASSIFYAIVLYYVLDWVFKNLSIYQFEYTWYSWVLAMIALDFMWYWYHRAGHEINLLWAAHITHHQSEEFNLTVGFRLSLFQAIYRTFFWSFLPFIGFPPKMVIVVYSVQGLYQYFLHTRMIGKLGFLEHILVTPSSHRVHHGRNQQYLDKNYGGLLIIWDKIFGTFEPEEEPVDFGITTGFPHPNPYKALFHYWQDLYQQFKAINNWQDKITLLFSHPGWTPDHKTQKKIVPISKPNPTLPGKLRIYVLAHLITPVAGIIILLTIKDLLPLSTVFLGGLYVAIMAMNAGLIATQKTYLFIFEKARIFLGIVTYGVFFWNESILLDWYWLIILLFLISYVWLLWIERTVYKDKKPSWLYRMRNLF